MSQDFADNHFEGVQHRPALLWLVAGVLLGGLVVLLWVLFLGEDSRTHHLAMVPSVGSAPRDVSSASSTVMTQRQAPAKAVQTRQASASSQAKKARFEFYQTLAEPDIRSQPVAARRAKVSKKPSSKVSHYLLQVASVNRFADADRLKAELSLLGYEVYMRKAFVKNHHWHRISVGPYQSLVEAQRAKEDLSKNNIKSMLLKTKL